MRHIFLACFCILSVNIFAQNVDIVSNDTTQQQIVDGIYDIQPQFPGGQEALLAYLKNYIRYPRIAEHYGVEGRAVMSFLVNTNGRIKEISAIDVNITKVHDTRFSTLTVYEQKELKERFAKAFAKELYRAIKAMPRWKPGEQIVGDTRRVVKVRYTLPIAFSM